MPLRHGNRQQPRWLELSAGPFLIVMGIFGCVAIVLDGALTFGNVAGFLLSLFLASAGVSLTFDTFFRKN